MSKISVIIADPQYLTREGIASLIRQEKDFELIEIFSTHQSLQEKLSFSSPDLLILNYPDGSDNDSAAWVTSILKKAPKANSLIVSDDKNKTRIREVAQVGIKGWVTKSSTQDEILGALYATAKGHRYLCQEILEVLTDAPLQEAERHKHFHLSSREYEVLELITRGQSTAIIADHLNISIHTVNSHRKNILRKLNVSTPIQLVTYAIESGLVKLDMPGDPDR